MFMTLCAAHVPTRTASLIHTPSRSSPAVTVALCHNKLIPGFSGRLRRTMRNSRRSMKPTATDGTVIHESGLRPGILRRLLNIPGSLWLNLPIRSKCLAVIALPVACLIFEIGWQIRILKALDDAQQWTTHTQQVQLTVAELQQLLLRIESNDRGYGLSGSN